MEDTNEMMSVDEIKREFAKSPTNGIRSVFQEFIHLEAAAGILLLIFSGLALGWANSPWGQSYFDLWNGTYLTIGLGEWALSKPLILWINDGLMAIFFFVVGLEIKREVLAGELSSPRKAALPLAAAIGGMLFPALIYVAFNAGGPSADGWGVPMATDIAFTLGVLALLGTKAPLSLKIFVTALAIVDDIGAVLVIAFFYTADLSLVALAVGAGFLLTLAMLNRVGVKSTMPYLVLGVGVWMAVLYSGVHATIAGVLVAVTIPARAQADRRAFVETAHQALKAYEAAIGDQVVNGISQRQAATWALEVASEKAESPLQRLEHELHPWVSYLIMPVFALANAGVSFAGSSVGSVVSSPLTLGILIGLAVGKPLGITLMSWLAVRLRLADLPEGITFRHILGAGWLAGIGFTMALFIANLAFVDAAQLNAAKIGILTASAVAGMLGWTLLRTTPEPAPTGSKQPAFDYEVAAN
jgi:NhaA family Na+:H+ antiporter